MLDRGRRRAEGRRILIGLVAVALACVTGERALAQRYDGFNVIAVPKHPYGSPSARAALEAARRAGADAVAIVPFLWQRHPSDAELVRGDDMPDELLQLAIREARALGLRVMVKPHVWVDGSWPGAVNPDSADGWRTWFDRYRASVERIARVAAEEGAEAFSVGTELKLTTQRPEWRAIIAGVREAFPGLLTYSAHNVEEAEAVAFWPQLDAIGVTLYPKLGADADRDGRRAVMQAVAGRLERLAAQRGKPVLVTEIGLRSAVGAVARPWESAEERTASPDPGLQAEVLADWLAALDRPAVSGVLVWRWFTDPAAGGPEDTDFTVQGKPAERLFACARSKDCN
jgi:hypothetical protein